MKIFLKIEQYSGPQPFEHWVSRIAVTTCYDWLRRSKARPLVSYSDLSDAEVFQLSPDRDAGRGRFARDAVAEQDPFRRWLRNHGFRVYRATHAETVVTK